MTSSSVEVGGGVDFMCEGEGDVISERANSLIMLNRNFNAIYLCLGFVATSVVRRSLRYGLAHARNY